MNQGKLRISQPDDKDEKEADRVAEQVMRSASPEIAVNSEDGRSTQRNEGSGETPVVEAETAQQIESLKGSGRPLSESVQSVFEPLFGHEFGDVRIHDGREAADLNRALNARAFTYGRDIFFGSGNYQPATTTGQGLLAHELTHSIQQETGRPSTKPTVVGSDAPSERDAMETTERVAAGDPTVPTTRLNVAAIQRTPKAEKLISTHTSWGNLDEKGLGKTLLQRALDGEHEFVQKVLDTLGWGNRDDVSYGFMVAAKDSDLRSLTNTGPGRKLLDRIYDELTGGSLSEEEQAQSDRILRAKTQQISPKEFQRDIRNPMIFPFKLPGITVFDDAPITAERRPGGKVWVKMLVRVKGSSTYSAETRTLPDEVFISGIELPEDRIVGIKRYDQGGTIQYRPALYLVRLSNETTTKVATTAAEAAGYGLTLGAGLVGAGAKGASWGARAVLWLDRAAAAIGVIGTLVSDHRGWIIRKFGDSGREFVRWVETIDSAVSLYDITTVAASMGRSINSLRKAFSEWKDVRRTVELEGDQAEVAEQLTNKTDEFLESIDRAAKKAKAETTATRRGVSGGAEARPTRRPEAESTRPAEPSGEAPTRAGAPTKGQRQAQELGYPEAPEGHHWHGNPDGQPHLQRNPSYSGERQVYDPEAGEFRKATGRKQSSRPRLRRGKDAPRIPDSQFRHFEMRLTGDAAKEQQRILRKAKQGGQAATKAGNEYQDLIARDLGAGGLQEAFSRPGRRMDVGNRHEVTIEGRSARFSTSKLDQLWLDMRDNGTVLLTVPRLSDQAASQLRRLAGQAQEEFGKKIMVFVRETATGAALPRE